jgi:hypothetical protein
MAPCRDDTPPAARAAHRDDRACRFAAHVLKTSTLSEMRTERHGFVAPRKHVARRLVTISEAAVSSILAMLITEGKVRICRATLT